MNKPDFEGIGPIEEDPEYIRVEEMSALLYIAGIIGFIIGFIAAALILATLVEMGVL